MPSAAETELCTSSPDTDPEPGCTTHREASMHAGRPLPLTGTVQ